MTPERYQRIKALYQAALERAEDERAQFIAQVCGDDGELLSEVETLLAAEDAAGGFVDSGGIQAALPSFPPLSSSPSSAPSSGAATASEFATNAPPAPAADRRIGPYRLIREIGHGGMGAVFLAERADREFKQRVALKLIKRGLDTDEIIARFRHERQILAALDHPNIARLLDGGTTSDGLPYFVMEYVEGEPLDAYCTTYNLTLHERLNLFRTVCGAVHYAHQNLVVHRDLKPANILVTAEGVPKLLDFGIAKVLNPALMSDTLAPTATSARPMTPAYASPEQVRGQTITTASDVYALGVILYELLTGQRPYEIKGKELHEVVQAVCESVPNKPSTAVFKSGLAKDKTGTIHDDAETARWRKQLAGDLDNIVLMALRKEPQRRYASVEQFSEDLRRHLAGLPVIAREDTFKYRASKFVQRNKAAVTAAVLFAVLLLAFLGTTLVQSVRIARERDRAERERVKAEKVSSFLVDLFKVNDPGAARGNQVTAREILDKGADKIRAELKDQPETQATLLHTVGEVYYSLGLYERSATLLEEALQQRRHLLGNEHPDVARTATALAQSVFDLGQNDRTEALTREALAIRRKIYGNQSREVAESLNDLALLTKLKGDFAAAEPLYRETIALQRKLSGNESLDVATTLHNLGVLLSDKKDFAGAEAAEREALAIRRQRLGPDAPDVAMTMHNLASMLRNKGDTAGAEQTLRDTLALRRKIYPDGHPQTALTLHNLGTLLRDRHEYAQAEACLREALAIRLKTLPAEHPHIGRVRIELGRVLVPQKAYAEALTQFNEGLRIAQKTKDATYVPHALDGLGDLASTQKQFAEAETNYLKSYELYQTFKDAERVQAVKEKLVKLYEAWGKPEKAAPFKQQE
ncbi:MAG: serine/threonine protein kinase [Acidobacteria bacterium]|nr:serine/threonine protein kinase [Acidobacteriota bacterium]